MAQSAGGDQPDDGGDALDQEPNDSLGFPPKSTNDVGRDVGWKPVKAK
jgi:hypothetical protein